MTPHPQPTTRTRITRATLILAIGGALFFLAMPGTAKPGDPAGDDAEITVEFHDDDMGFNVTSTKGISNVWVLFCEADPHKHEISDEIHFFNHTETDVVTGVYVKSGDNGVDVPGLGGAGEFFANEGVDCGGPSSSTSDTDTETSGSETESETTGSESESETTGSETDSETTGSETQTETEEIPVFGTATALALGVGGALGGTLLMLRRKL